MGGSVGADLRLEPSIQCPDSDRHFDRFAREDGDAACRTVLRLPSEARESATEGDGLARGKVNASHSIARASRRGSDVFTRELIM
jgi:hypothetical protein